jgi:hypothetical protein
MVCASIFADPSDPRIMLDSHRHEKLKECQDFNVHFCQVYLVEFTCCILESAASLKRLTLDATCGNARCTVSKIGKCWSMSTEAVVEPAKPVLAVERHIKPKVPSTVELKVLEPCSRCHAAQILAAGCHDDSA